MNPSGLQSGNGPNDGFLPSENSDGVTAFLLLYNKDQTITGSALVQWKFWTNAMATTKLSNK